MRKMAECHVTRTEIAAEGGVRTMIGAGAEVSGSKAGCRCEQIFAMELETADSSIAEATGRGRGGVRGPHDCSAWRSASHDRGEASREWPRPTLHSSSPAGGGAQDACVPAG